MVPAAVSTIAGPVAHVASLSVPHGAVTAMGWSALFSDERGHLATERRVAADDVLGMSQASAHVGQLLLFMEQIVERDS